MKEREWCVIEIQTERRLCVCEKWGWGARDGW